MNTDPYTGWMVNNHAETIEHLGWTEVENPCDPPAPGMPRKFVKINGGPLDFLWQPQDVGLVALAYRLGYCDGAMFALGSDHADA